ncbi:MAG: hypothetical protein GF411_02895 [Candidatus Lokiarchaeota archaeon]|nr:hypothetical protein [Candidatus Lokiarchaeota archaeon]
MLDFNKLKKAVHKQLSIMSEDNLFRTDTDKDEIWDVYLSSFPDGSDPIHKERTEHDCQCCKQFIKNYGNIVSIIDNKKVSVWNFKINDESYQMVIDTLARYVESKSVHLPFYTTSQTAGCDFNHGLSDDGDAIRYDHFYFKFPRSFVIRSDDIGKRISEDVSTVNVFRRGLEEITMDAVETVMELIDQNSIYRGEENRGIIEVFAKHKMEYIEINDDDAKNNYVWFVASKIGGTARIRNTAIGTLLTNLSEGTELDSAVSAFEKMVAPTNYKRPKALVTKAMIKNAQDKVEKLGLSSALSRRYAVMDDLTINNVIFADRAAKKEMNVFDELMNEVPDNPKNFKKVEEVGIDTFINDIVPKSETIELHLENRHEPNLVSLIAPVNTDVKPLFKWRNNFSWSYNGEVADSIIRERVKNAGGNVNGVLRFSIQWNEDGNNQNDFDAHCYEPGNHIWFQNKGHIHPSSGMLDVDIIHPDKDPAVENITWTSLAKMKEGTYKFLVHCYSYRGGRTGFTAEIEYDGIIHTFVYDKELRQDEEIIVAECDFNKVDGIKFNRSLPSTVATKEFWGISTNQFHKVRVIMNSPNHWDGEKTGNKHWFFMLENCRSPWKSRGFFNEFLSNELTEHRKVFEVLGSKMKAEPSDEQLSGLGFSSTKRNSVLCRVTGKSSRIVKILF